MTDASRQRLSAGRLTATLDGPDLTHIRVGGVEIVRENLDECILCNLCVEAAPPGGVVVKKLYDGTDLRR